MRRARSRYFPSGSPNKLGVAIITSNAISITLILLKVAFFWESTLDIGIDIPSLTSGIQGMKGLGLIVGLIALAGFIGRLVFVSFGSSIKNANPLRNFSGLGLIATSIALFVGALMVTGKLDKAVHQIQRNTIDPFTIYVLQRDSCDLSSGKYCVIVFEGDREISVNWFDSKIYMWELLNPQTGAVYKTLRPRSREGNGESTGEGFS